MIRSALLLLAVNAAFAAGGSYTLIGWNDLGMHCMDGDYTVFAVLPPYNTIHAQLVDPAGKLVRSPAGITVTYQAVADTTGSVNTSSALKSNFWQFAKALFGADLAPEAGLTGNSMPGTSNQPQGLKFEASYNWFTADGIPLTPFDDTGNKNPYPMMRLVAQDAAGNLLASTDIVLPVSDEMDCRACHASGSADAAKPAAGWVYDPAVERDYKLNILRRHDDHQGANPAYRNILAAAGYNQAGLYASVTQDGRPVLCAACHASNALSAAGQPGVPPLTTSLHDFHAHVMDPVTGMTLDASGNRSACYRCHPGALTRCLRGVMANSVAADGTLDVQCQSCHGGMSEVGAAGRQGWLDEPNCQGCHTGTANSNSGQMRFLTVFDATGSMRRPANATFATTPNQPAGGFSLYRFSAGHGNLACEACHGSTHAEWPSSHANDNVQAIALQGSAGKLGDCATCHSGMNSTTGGPHGLHTTGQAWVSRHSDVAEHNTASCQGCHGTDYRGTTLSRALVARTLTSRYGTLQIWPGFQVSCYACHNGPDGESATRNHAPTVSDAGGSTAVGAPVSFALSAADSDGNALALSVLTQPANGTAVINGSTATYTPFAGFEGTDSFTFAAWDGMIHSNLASATIQVTAQARPQLQAGGILNAAGYQGGGIAAGEILILSGNGMGPGSMVSMQVNSAGLVNRLLSDTRVLFDGVAAPLVYTSSGYVSAVAPFAITGKSSTQVQVEYQGIRSTAVSVPVTVAMPAIFSNDATGKGQGAILNQDYTRNGTSNPAPRSTIVMIYATGLGALDTPVLDGQTSFPVLARAVTQPVTVQIGGLDATVSYAGVAPGIVAGVMQINAKVPPGVAPGSAVPVVLWVAGSPSQDGITMAVK